MKKKVKKLNFNTHTICQWSLLTSNRLQEVQYRETLKEASNEQNIKVGGNIPKSR